MIKKIDHIGIAVESLTDTVPVFRDVLKLELVAEEEIPEQKVRVAIFAVGDVRIELLEPTSPDSPISAFLTRRGNGIHHIAFETDDISGELARFSACGAELIDKNPRIGTEGKKIAFVHPKSTAKILTEICEG